MRQAELQFLGTGGSTGVPMIGCRCDVCTSTEPKNQRLRSSWLIRYEDRTILVDAGPDFRQQALRYGIDGLDGVMLTHAHYDHVGGMDDLRVYYFATHKALPCLVSRATYADLQQRLHYIFGESSQRGSGDNITAQFALQVIEGERGETHFAGLPFRYFTFHQGATPVMGYRFGTLAIVSDIRSYPSTLLGDLSGVETLILSALRFEPSHVHFSIDEAVAFAHSVGAKQTYFVHMAHELDHEQTNSYLPEGMSLSYDGLKVSFYV